MTITGTEAYETMLAHHRVLGEREPEPVAAPVLAGPDLDVRDLPPARRHEAIFDAYRALLPSTGFMLVNDHDPKPLRYQFEAQYPGEFTWDYQEAGPKVWRVRIGRARALPEARLATLAGQERQHAW